MSVWNFCFGRRPLSCHFGRFNNGYQTRNNALTTRLSLLYGFSRLEMHFKQFKLSFKIFFFSRHFCRHDFQLLSAPVCAVCLLLITLLRKTLSAFLENGLFLYIRRTKYILINSKIPVSPKFHVQKRNFHFNLLEPLKD